MKTIGSGTSDPLSICEDNFLDFLGEEKVAHSLFTWTIENFSLLPDCDQKRITSPIFKFESVPSSWFITFYPYFVQNDQTIAQFFLVRRDSNEEPGIVTVTYRFGVKVSGVDMWFEEKRGILFHPGESNNTEFLLHQYFKNGNVFSQNNFVILCEMYVSQWKTYMQTSKSLKTKFGAEYMDLKFLSLDMFKIMPIPIVFDVLIVVKDLTIPSHKAILSARSAYFNRLIKTCSDLYLLDDDYDHIFNILSYIYSGSFYLKARKACMCIGLYECAKRFLVRGLKELLTPTQISRHSSVREERIDFTWTVENFSSLLVKTDDCIRSSCFGNGGKNAHIWYLELYPKGRSLTSNRVDFLVKTTKMLEAPRVRIVASILDGNLQEIFTRCIEKLRTTTSVFSFPSFIDKDQLVKNSKLLQNDKLIINCKIEMYVIDHSLSKNRIFACSSSVEHADFERLSEDFSKLLSDENYSDVTMVTDTDFYYAHKAILATRSSVLASLVLNCDDDMDDDDMDDDCTATIGIIDVPSDIFDMVIRYIYTGKLRSIKSDLAIQLYEAGKVYEMTILVQRCSNILSSALDIKSFRDVIVLSHKYKDKALMTKCLRYFKRHSNEILPSSEWKNLSETKPNMSRKLLQLLRL